MGDRVLYGKTMKPLSIFLIFFLFFSQINWKATEIDPSLNELEIDRSDWTYPWYVIKHDDHFENTAGDSISKQDTAHLVRNSHCFVQTDHEGSTISSRLPFAKAEWKNDTLMLSVWQYNASDIQTLTFKVIDGKFSSAYEIAYIISPDLYSLKILEQSLSLNDIPEPGHPIKGRINMVLQEEIILPSWATEKEGTDTVLKKIEGTFVIEG